MGFYIDSKLDAYINEGCNAVSLMLIFVAFVFAFYNGFVKSLLFCLGSIVFLHFTNIGRITLLSLINYHHPTWSKFSHDVIFPLIIYGAIILLWIVWISLFIRSKKAA
ncbi:MAG: exosortase family protein XrtF [Flavobacteriaceae bacterium]|nr:MAG: exosortase family protein XrtF [Flavobacteriaceae bacterium]